MRTKDSIIDSSLRLFNRKGSYSVTTRHIAADMKISPGNLYYHYRNKEEIIRIILSRMIEEFNVFYRPVQSITSPDELLTGIINGTGKIMYSYRFFFMELPTLLEKDPSLKKMYMKIKQERIDDLKAVINLFEKKYITSEPIDENELLIAALNAWTLSEFLIQSMYINQIKITPETISSRFSQVLHILKPYLKKEFREILK